MFGPLPSSLLAKDPVAKATRARDAIHNAAYGGVAGWMGVPRPDDTTTSRLEAYSHSLPTYNAAFAKWTAIMRIPLRFYFVGETEDDKDEVPRTHPLVQLFQSPNDDMTPTRLWAKTAMYLELAGEAFWELGTDDGLVTTEAQVKGKLPHHTFGEPTGIWPLRPDRITIWPGRGGLGGYSHSLGVHVPPTWFSPAEVVHFRYEHPTSDFHGHSPQLPAAEAIKTHLYASRWNRRFFENGVGGTYFATDEEMTPEQQNEQAAHIKERISAEKQHSVFVLAHGLKPHPTNESRKDMEFNELVDTSNREILSAWDVPPVIDGETEAKYANAAIQFGMWNSQSLDPTLTMMESEITHRVCPRFSGDGQRIVAEFDRRELPGIDEGKKVQAEIDEIHLRCGVMNIDEVRRRDGLDEIPGGAGKVHRVPGNTVELTSDDEEESALGFEPGGDTPNGNGARPEAAFEPGAGRMAPQP